MSLGRHREPSRLRALERRGHVGLLHVPEARDDAVEAVLELLDLDRLCRIDRRHVDDRDRQQDDLLVQHLVVRQVVHENRRRALRSAPS